MYCANCGCQISNDEYKQCPFCGISINYNDNMKYVGKYVECPSTPKLNDNINTRREQRRNIVSNNRPKYIDSNTGRFSGELSKTCSDTVLHSEQQDYRKQGSRRCLPPETGHRPLDSGAFRKTESEYYHANSSVNQRGGQKDTSRFASKSVQPVRTKKTNNPCGRASKIIIAFLTSLIVASGFYYLYQKRSNNMAQERISDALLNAMEDKQETSVLLETESVNSSQRSYTVEGKIININEDDCIKLLTQLMQESYDFNLKNKITRDYSEYKISIYPIDVTKTANLIFFNNKSGETEAISLYSTTDVGDEPKMLGAMMLRLVNQVMGASRDEAVSALKNVLDDKKQTLNDLTIEPIEISDDAIHVSFYPTAYESKSEAFAVHEFTPKDLMETKEDYDKIAQLLEDFNFKELSIIATEYLNVHPESTGNAFLINQIISDNIKVLEYQDFLYSSKDEIEQISYLYYPAVESINWNVNLVTYIKNSNVRCVAGFINSDWVFFGEIIVSPEGGKPKSTAYKSTDITRDVLTDGSVIEYLDLSPSSFESINYFDTVTLRFKNIDSGNYLDHVLTNEEVQAFRAMSLLRNVYRQLSDKVVFPVKQAYYKKS